MKKLISILLVFALAFTFTACKKEEPPIQVDFEKFHSEFSAAYDAFVKTESGKKSPFANVDDMLVHPECLESVFVYIKNGTNPENAEITAVDNKYQYKTKEFSVTVEFDNNTSAIRFTKTMNVSGSFTVTMREKDDVYYIQYFASEFLTYHEIKFTASSGSVKTISRSDLPYSIFAAEIPEYFAKEN